MRFDVQKKKMIDFSYEKEWNLRHVSSLRRRFRLEIVRIVQFVFNLVRDQFLVDNHVLYDPTLTVEYEIHVVHHAFSIAQYNLPNFEASVKRYPDIQLHLVTIPRRVGNPWLYLKCSILS